MTDEPLWSAKRIATGLALWGWLVCQEPSVYVGFWRMVRFHRRPFATARYDALYDARGAS